MKLRLGGVGDAFADRNFRIYSIGSVLSWLSFYVQMVAISWTAWELTHSTIWLAIVAVLGIAPSLIFLPLGGVLADRGPFRLHAICDFRGARAAPSDENIYGGLTLNIRPV
jgi:MFS family permease